MVEREELRTKLDEHLESNQISLTISDETINGELDDVIEDLAEDAEVDDALLEKIAKRLKRIDGNLHADVSREVKKLRGQKTPPKSKKVTKKSTKNEDGDDDDDDDDELEALKKRLNDLEESQKKRAKQDSDEKILGNVKKGLKAKFEKAGIEVNQYIMKQTLRDMVIPEVEEGQKVDISDLVDKMEKAYHKNLKEAGLDKKSVGPRFNRQTGNGKNAADRYFLRKQKREGWGQGNKKE